MLTGSCLCGGVTYQIDGPLTQVRNCKCSIRRKAHSAAFRSPPSVRSQDFRWTAGENVMAWYETSAGTQRVFCSRCGSPLLSRFAARPDVCGLPLGCLDTDPGVRPAMNIYVVSKTPWFEITDLLPHHEKGPPR